MRTLLSLTLVLTPLLAACTAEVSVTPATSPTAPVAQTLEAGCGACIYKIEGATGCPLAVDVAGTPMLVTGTDFDAMGNGLCLEKKQVQIAGAVEGTSFAATSVTLAE